jgi:hypothetical protein
MSITEYIAQKIAEGDTRDPQEILNDALKASPEGTQTPATPPTTPATFQQKMAEQPSAPVVTPAVAPALPNTTQMALPELPPTNAPTLPGAPTDMTTTRIRQSIPSPNTERREALYPLSANAAHQMDFRPATDEEARLLGKFEIPLTESEKRIKEWTSVARATRPPIEEYPD